MKIYGTKIDYNTKLKDAFSRLRVSAPLTLFDNQHQYNTQLSVGSVINDILRDIALGLNLAGDTGDIISIVCTSLGAATATAAALTVKEFY